MNENIHRFSLQIDMDKYYNSQALASIYANIPASFETLSTSEKFSSFLPRNCTSFPANMMLSPKWNSAEKGKEMESQVWDDFFCFVLNQFTLSNFQRCSYYDDKTKNWLPF